MLPKAFQRAKCRHSESRSEAVRRMASANFPASFRSSLDCMAGRVRSRRPAKPCRVPAYDCCDADDSGNWG